MKTTLIFFILAILGFMIGKFTYSDHNETNVTLKKLKNTDSGTIESLQQINVNQSDTQVKNSTGTNLSNSTLANATTNLTVDRNTQIYSLFDKSTLGQNVALVMTKGRGGEQNNNVEDRKLLLKARKTMIENSKAVLEQFRHATPHLSMQDQNFAYSMVDILNVPVNEKIDFYKNQFNNLKDNYTDEKNYNEALSNSILLVELLKNHKEETKKIKNELRQISHQMKNKKLQSFLNMSLDSLL